VGGLVLNPLLFLALICFLIGGVNGALIAIVVAGLIELAKLAWMLWGDWF
jgi:hypothetical protein